MDQFTFGNSKAAINLVFILRELKNKKLNRKVSRILSNHNTKFNNLINYYYTDIMKGTTYYHKLYNKDQHVYLLIKDVCEVISNNETLPLKVRTHMINVIKTSYKIYLRNETKTYKKTLSLKYQYEGYSRKVANRLAYGSFIPNLKSLAIAVFFGRATK